LFALPRQIVLGYLRFWPVPTFSTAEPAQIRRNQGYVASDTFALLHAASLWELFVTNRKQAQRSNQSWSGCHL